MNELQKFRFKLLELSRKDLGKFTKQQLYIYRIAQQLAKEFYEISPELRNTTPKNYLSFLYYQAFLEYYKDVEDYLLSEEIAEIFKADTRVRCDDFSIPDKTITIVFYKDVKIEHFDTPMWGCFGGEVESINLGKITYTEDIYITNLPLCKSLIHEEPLPYQLEFDFRNYK